MIGGKILQLPFSGLAKPRRIDNWSKGNLKMLSFLSVSNLTFCSICKHFKMPFWSKMFKMVPWLQSVNFQCSKCHVLQNVKMEFPNVSQCGQMVSTVFGLKEVLPHPQWLSSSFSPQEWLEKFGIFQHIANVVGEWLRANSQ